MSSSEQTGLTIVGAGIGFAIGGPMGAIYGASIGYTVGMSSLSTTLPAVDGPRLSDLKVQANTYGWNIPKAWGTFGNNGALVWSSGIEEKKHTENIEQGGKGAPSVSQEVNTYTYSVSFAILFHDGPIKAVRRIYANEFLVYDAGDLSEYGSMSDSETADWITTKLQGLGEDSGDVTVYIGSETQNPDPTIQSYEGAGNVPGFRGFAYLVFTNLQLAKFGNRIPQIRVEYVSSVDDPDTSNSLIKSVDYSDFGYGNSLDDRVPTIDRDGIAHLFVATDPDSGISPMNMEYFKILPNGTLSFVKNMEVVNTVNTQHPHAVAEIPMIFTADTATYDTTVFQPNGSLHEPGEDFSFVLSGVDFEYVNTSDYQSYSQIGNNYSGKIFYWGNGNEKFRVYEYSKYIDVSLIGAVSTEIDIRFHDFDIYDGSTQGGTKAFAVSDRYLYAVYGNGTVRRYDHDGALLDTWTQSPPMALSVNRHGVQIDKDDDDLIYIESSGNFYRFESGVYSSIGSSFGFTGNPSTFAVYSNMLIAPILDIEELRYYSIGDIARTAESLDVVVGDLLVECGYSSSDYDVTALAAIEVDGFARSSISAPSKSIELLMQAYQFSCYEDEGKLVFNLRGASVDKTIDSGDMGAGINSSRDRLYVQERLDDQNLPLTVNVSYIDPNSEYDVSTQSSRRSRIYDTEQVLDVDLPLVMSADSARQVAEILQTATWTARTSYKEISVPLEYIDITPTDVVDFSIDGIYQRIRISSCNIGEFIELSGMAESQADYTSIISGEQRTLTYRGSNNPGISEFYLIDCPALRDQDGDTGFYIAAHGYLPSWRGCVVYSQSPSGGWTQVASVVDPATAGIAIDELPDGVHEVVDYASTVTLRMRNGSLSSSTLANVIADKTVNAAILGRNGAWELFQFITATDNGNGTYTLSGLVRGQNGTEWAMDEHQAGDTFILLTAVALSRAYTFETGTRYLFRGVSIGREFQSGEDRYFTNRATGTKPFSPANLKATDNADGTYTLTWNRRTRVFGDWRDYADVPLGEASESYRVQIYYLDNLISTTTVSTASATVNAVPGYTARVAQISEYYGAGEETSILIGGDTEYATYDPSAKSADITLTNSNLTATGTAGAWKSAKASEGVSTGKWYWEITIDAVVTGAMVGVGKSAASVNNYAGVDTNGWSYGWGGEKWHNSSNTAYGASWTDGDVISVALDLTAGKIWFAKNGVWQNSGDPAAGTGEAFSSVTGPVTPQDSPYSSSGMTANFGQFDMTYTPPTGFTPGVF